MTQVSFEHLVAYPEHYPDALAELFIEMSMEEQHHGLSIERLSWYRTQFKQHGYTFDIGMDCNAYDLRQTTELEEIVAELDPLEDGALCQEHEDKYEQLKAAKGDNYFKPVTEGFVGWIKRLRNCVDERIGQGFYMVDGPQPGEGGVWIMRKGDKVYARYCTHSDFMINREIRMVQEVTYLGNQLTDATRHIISGSWLEYTALAKGLRFKLRVYRSKWAIDVESLEGHTIYMRSMMTTDQLEKTLHGFMVELETFTHVVPERVELCAEANRLIHKFIIVDGMDTDGTMNLRVRVSPEVINQLARYYGDCTVVHNEGEYTEVQLKNIRILLST